MFNLKDPKLLKEIIEKFMDRKEPYPVLAEAMIKPIRQIIFPKILKIPCKICGELTEIGADKGCPHCLARSVIET